MLFIYDIIFLFLFIPVFIFFFLKRIRNLKEEFFYKAKERFGFWDFRKGLETKDVLWFHCASVGEIRAIESLVKVLKGFTIVITTVTPSGLRYLKNNKISDFFFFIPLDFSFFINKVLNKINLKALFLIEAELWPGLILEVKKHKVKIVVINGRISSRAYRYYNISKYFWKKVLNKIDIICARYPEDAQRFKRLGCDEKKIFVTGNIKYDRNFMVPNFSRKEINISDSDIVLVAGSTKEKEEEKLITAFAKLKNKFANLKLILVPRHIFRALEIKKLLRIKKIKYSLYSSRNFDGFDCMIVDTFGDLMKFYSIADLVFVGGSFVNKGGQNPIEPASLSKVILFGPHMENFSNEADLLIENGGGFVVKSEAELYQKANELLTDKRFLIKSGKKARECVMKQKGALKNIMEIVLPLLK